jgi:hypothetical protein
MVLILLVKSQCDVTVAASKVNPRDRDPRLAADSIQQVRHAVLLMDRRVAQLVDDTIAVLRIDGRTGAAAPSHSNSGRIGVGALVGRDPGGRRTRADPAQPDRAVPQLARLARGVTVLNRMLAAGRPNSDRRRHVLK